ncbi:MAG: hypothetical protein ONA90_03335 [candidate division KSB1 bacterium]|nr:hypothetical protein [candidate division KSB1 bacterium]
MNCSEKGITTTEVLDAEFSLHYDQGQLSSPFLAAGSYEAAARFTEVQIGNRVGREVVEVHYYIANKPQLCNVKIYGPQSASMPGSLVYSAEVTSATQANQWNVHQLTQGVKLAAEDIWISIEFSHSSGQATIGCDPGPAVKDGDWLYATADGTWKPLSQRTTIRINWNIRGIVK